MKIFIYLLLSLCVVVSNAYANRSLRLKRYDLLRDAVAKMIKVPVFTERMAWERGGVAMDEFVKYLEVHESSVYSSYSERGLRLQLGKALHEELNRDVFSLTVRVDGRQVSQYFVGEAPDLEAIISEVMAIPELNAKMKWENEGLTMDEIMTAVIESYPDVQTLYLYVQASPHKTEHGLRVALGMVLDAELNGKVFSLPVEMDGRHVHTYFVGEAPDLAAIISEVMAIPKINAKMKWENGGLTMDEIMAAVIETYPAVHTLYVQASPNKTAYGLRTSLGKVWDAELNGKVFSLLVKVDGRSVRKYFVGEAPDLEAIISEVMAIPERNAKMKWENEGLTMDEIMAAVIETYPDVHTLYVQASPNKNEHGLRIALGKVLGGMDRIVSRNRGYFWKK